MLGIHHYVVMYVDGAGNVAYGYFQGPDAQSAVNQCREFDFVVSIIRVAEVVSDWA